MQNISLLQNTWNKAIYGWDLTQIGQTLIVVPDLNHWLKNEKDPEKLKLSFDLDKFAEQVAAKGVTDIIFKATDANQVTGVQFVDKTAPFWHWLGGQLGLRRGAFHWLQYSVDPTLAWEYYRKFLDQYPCEWPHIADVEESSVTDASDYVWRAQVWFSHANEDGGKQALCYTGLWYIDKLKDLLIRAGKRWIDKLSWLHTQPLWLAAYSRYWPTVFVKKFMSYRVYDNKPLWPWTEDELAGWQYTSRGHFPYEGYSTNENGRNWGFDGDGLDMNYFVKSWLDANVKMLGTVPDPVEPAPVVVAPSDSEKLARLWAAHPELH